MPEANVSDVKQHGLKWEEQGFNLLPLWTVEPNRATIAEIAAHHLASEVQDKGLEVTWLANGAFNKIYDVRIGDDLPRYVFRASLPVDPFYKTESEVATLEYVKAHTNMPVAGVVAYDSSATNSLGFEWILMEKLPGICLEDAWSSMSWDQKEVLTRTVARMTLSLQNPSFENIGSLYLASQTSCPQEAAPPFRSADMANSETEPQSLGQEVQGAQPMSHADMPSSTTDQQYVVGRLVDRAFFRGKRVFLDVCRGPYDSSQKFVEACIDIQITSLEHLSDDPIRDDLTALDNSLKESFDDLDDDESIDAMIDVCRELREHVHATFGNVASHEQGLNSTVAEGSICDSKVNERFVLTHTDMSAKNILVDPHTYQLSGIIDWEFAATSPLWQAVDYPLFLNSKECELEDLENCEGDMLIERQKFYQLTQLRKQYNQTVLQAGCPSPDAFRQDRASRRKWKFLELLDAIEDSGPLPLKYFLEHTGEEYWVTNDRSMPGLYVPDKSKV